MNRTRAAAAALLASLTLSGTALTAPAAGSPSPGRGLIVWTLSSAPGENGHLVVARPDGSGQRQLTPDDPDANDIDAVLSPDGNQVLFERDLETTAQVRVVDASGGPSVRVSLPCAAGCFGVGRPTWLGGHQIAWTRWDEGDQYPGGYVGTIWTATFCRGAVSHVRRLSPKGPRLYDDGYARLAPNGRTVVFERYQTTDAHQAVFRMNRDGSGLAQLTPWELDADLPRVSPATYGPTVGLVVFQSYGEGNPTGTSRDLATVPVTCGSLAACAARIRFVTHNGAGEGRASNPAWSPDGLRIAYAGRPSAAVTDAQIETIRFDGSDVRTVSTSPGFDYRPDWGPTGS